MSTLHWPPMPQRQVQDPASEPTPPHLIYHVCYACGVKRSLLEFQYQEEITRDLKDDPAPLKSGSRLGRWWRDKTRSRKEKERRLKGMEGDGKYRYRCVHPMVGACPKNLHAVNDSRALSTPTTTSLAQPRHLRQLRNDPGRPLPSAIQARATVQRQPQQQPAGFPARSLQSTTQMTARVMPAPMLVDHIQKPRPSVRPNLPPPPKEEPEPAVPVRRQPGFSAWSEREEESWQDWIDVQEQAVASMPVRAKDEAWKDRGWTGEFEGRFRRVGAREHVLF